MHETTERVLEALERGHLTRREAVGRLVALAAASFGAGHLVARAGVAAPPAQAPQAGGASPTFRSVGLNHVALRVTDLDRSRAFYERHLGLRTLRHGRHSTFMAAGGNHFVAFFRDDTPGLDHYCYTVEGYRPERAVDRLAGAGLEPVRHEDRVYFDDPDGIQVQVASGWGDYPGGGPVERD